MNTARRNCCVSILRCDKRAVTVALLGAVAMVPLHVHGLPDYAALRRTLQHCCCEDLLNAAVREGGVARARGALWFVFAAPFAPTWADEAPAIAQRALRGTAPAPHGSKQVEDTVGGWLNSPGHCASIIDPRFAETGLAYAVNADADEIYWTQVFATPAR